MTLPIIGITLGDVAGIGPEVVATALPPILRDIPCQPIVFGHPEILRRAIRLRNTSLDVVEPGATVLPGDPSKRVLVTPCMDDNVLDVKPGLVDAFAGEAAYQAIATAVKAAKENKIQAVVTAPIHKEALNLAGHCYPGHTELIADHCGVKDVAMMLYLGPNQHLRSPHGLAVVHVSLHISMRKMFDLITQENVLSKIKLVDQFMRRIIRDRNLPHIGVCSLNPHAGEGGLFGSEEYEIIRPAVEVALSQGFSVEGPCPADTIMIGARDGKFDAVVAMFHDQGHIAVKLLGIHRAVNITLGLPIIRTSVAHGTAFDIAWKGVANPGSLVEAVRVAALLCAKEPGM